MYHCTCTTRWHKEIVLVFSGGCKSCGACWQVWNKELVAHCQGELLSHNSNMQRHQKPSDLPTLHFAVCHLTTQELDRRLGKQCRERWFNHLDPDLKKDPFSSEEDATILRMKFSVGTKWAGIARELQGRTDNMVKNRYNSTLKRVMESLKAPLRDEGVITPGMSDADIGLACLQRMQEEGLLGPDINKMKTRPVHHKATTRNFAGGARDGASSTAASDDESSPPSPKHARSQPRRRQPASSSATAVRKSTAGTFGGAPASSSAPPPGAQCAPGGPWFPLHQAAHLSALASSQGMVFGSPPAQRPPPGTQQPGAGAPQLPPGAHFLSPPTMNAAHFLSLMRSTGGAGSGVALGMTASAASQILHSSFTAAASQAAASASATLPSSKVAASAGAVAAAGGAVVVPFAMTAGSRSASAASTGSDQGGPARIGGGVRAVPTAGGGVVERPRARRAQAATAAATGRAGQGDAVVTPPRSAAGDGAHGVPSPSGASSPGTEGGGAAMEDEDEATAESAAYLASLHPDMQGPEAADRLGADWEDMGGARGGTQKQPPSARRPATGGRHGVFSPQTPRVAGAALGGGLGRDSVERGSSFGAEGGDKAAGVEVPLAMTATPLHHPRTPLGDARGDALAAAQALTGMASSGRRPTGGAAAGGIAMRRQSRRPAEGGGIAAGRAHLPPAARRGVRRGALLGGGALPPRPAAVAASSAASAALATSTGLAPSPASMGGGGMPKTPLAMVTPNTVVALLGTRTSTGKGVGGAGAQPRVREQRVRACVPRTSLAGATENSPIPGRVLVYSSDDAESADELSGRRGGVKRSLSAAVSGADAGRRKAARAI